MRILEVTLTNGKKSTLFLNGNFVVTSTDIDNVCRISDGVHNNGGWEVIGTYKSIITRLRDSLNTHKV